MRIGAFFGRPTPVAPETGQDEVPSRVSSRRSSVVGLDFEAPSPDVRPPKSAKIDHDALFQPFFLHDNTKLAPVNRFWQSRHQMSFSGFGSDFSFCLDQDANSVIGSRPFAEHLRKRRRLAYESQPVKEIIEKLESSPAAATDVAAIDLTTETTNQPVQQLQKIPYKILSFKEDVRPPYQGTFTRAVSAASSRKISRNPFYRGLPETNYDYDSEAEWEEPQEGDEELNDEDDESEMEDGEDDMADFLDDEDDRGRRRLITGDVEPVSSGLCWGEGANAGRI